MDFKLSPVKDGESERLRTALGRASYKENCIYLGTDMVEGNRLLSWDCYISPFNKYPRVEHIYFNLTAEIIHHESMHLILNRVADRETSRAWDNIDTDLSISDFN